MVSGQASLTSPITLVQAPEEGPGFLLYYSVFSVGTTPSTPHERDKYLVGWTYMPIVATRILSGVDQELNDEIDFGVFAGAHAAPDRLIFDTKLHLLPERQGAPP